MADVTDHPPFEVAVVTPDGPVFDGEAHMTLKAGSTRVHIDATEVLEFATGPGFFKVELDRALALVDDAVNVKEIDDARAQAQLEVARAELEKVDAGESSADRWQLEQRIAHAENQLSVSGRTTG